LAQHPTPLGDTGLDLLAVPARRQALAPSNATIFQTPPGGAHPCRLAPRNVETLTADPIA